MYKIYDKNYNQNFNIDYYLRGTFQMFIMSIIVNITDFIIKK